MHGVYIGPELIECSLLLLALPGERVPTGGQPVELGFSSLFPANGFQLVGSPLSSKCLTRESSTCMAAVKTVRVGTGPGVCCPGCRRSRRGRRFQVRPGPRNIPGARCSRSLGGRVLARRGEGGQAWQCCWRRKGSGIRVGVGGAVVAGGSAISCKKPAARKKIVPRGHDGAVREVQRALEHAGEVVRRVGRLGEQAAQCPTG